MPETPVRILNVDDDPVKRYSVSRFLGRAGFEVLEAHTGADCLRLAREDVGLVVLDVNLPDMSGIEVCNQLRADPKLAGLMILHLSGTARDPEDQVQGLEAGADAYLTEPVDGTVLVATVRSLLRLRQAELLARELLSREQSARAEAEVRAGQLEAADRHKNEFLAMLGHELRNPLAAVTNALHTLAEDGLDERQANRIREIAVRQAGQLTRLVEDLLDLARINHGKTELRMELTPLTGVVEQAVQATESIFRERGHQLTVRIPEAPLYVNADAARITQVLANLLHNAAKYTEPGGQVSLTVERQDSPRTEAVIRVADSGIGMDRAMLARAFELFSQAEQPLGRPEGGLGIGLTLVRTIVEQHGGTVTASSEGPGKGSEFCVRLPVVPGPAPEAGREAPANGGHPDQPVSPVRQRVLLVEDNADALETLSELLGLWGYEVATASQGLTALEAVAQHLPHLILLDIGLPDIDGYEVARRLRRGDEPVPAGYRPYLVALTGYGLETDRELAREAGFDHHLTKPVDPTVLRELLRHTAARCSPETG